jgi:16S rRNA (guanine(1405)-N(7))-methyltransferase
MNDRKETDDTVDQIVRKILSSPKYRELGIPKESVEDIVKREVSRQTDIKVAEKKAREKLHQVVAPYLGDPDYRSAGTALTQIHHDDREGLKAWCLEMLRSHSSTRERLPNLELFYQTVFEFTGKPNTVLDLACGMNPFAFPWMGLEPSVRYYAFDLHTPRVNLINRFFDAWGLQPLATVTDVLVQVPQTPADVAFFFKEAHRFESRRKGSNRAFFQQLSVKWIVVTLPAENLTGRHQMRDRERMLIEKTITGLDWEISETEVGTEMIFFIRKYE